MTQHDRGMLWRTYEGLSPQQKLVIRLSALIGGDIPRGTFVQVMAASRSRAPDGKAWSGRSLEEQLQALRSRGLVDRDLTCVQGVRHAIAREAAEGEHAPVLGNALVRGLPHSDYERTEKYYSAFDYHRHELADDADLLRRIRIAVYFNDLGEFIRLRQIFDGEDEEEAHLSLALFLANLPADIEWLEARDPAIRDAIISGMITALVETGTVRSDTAAAIAQFMPAGEPVSAAMRKALLWRDLLSGKLDAAREGLAMLGPDDKIAASACGAVIQFLQGENAAAIASFRTALKQFREAMHTRKCVLPGAAGLFHLLALLQAHDPRLNNEIRNVLDGVQFAPGSLWTGYQAARALLHVTCGEIERAAQAIAACPRSEAENPLGAALMSLAALHVDSALVPKQAAKIEAVFNGIAAHLPLIGRIYAEILAKALPQQDRWGAVLRSMGMPGVISFVDIVGFKPKWERTFERLAAFLAPAGSALAKTEIRKRLIFRLDPRTNAIEALEQVCKAGTWSGGRPVSMKRLKEQDHKLEYLTPADRRVLQTIRKEQGGWYNYGYHAFDNYRSVLALIGHPAVFDARQPSRHVELFAHPAELIISESANGFAFTLSHRAEAPCVFIEEETPSRWRVIEVPKKLVDVQAMLGEDGLIVPAQMRERVMGLLRADNPSLPLRSELADAEMPTIEGVADPVLRLRRSGEGLSVALIVRPLGPEGPFYAPGQGGRSFLATQGSVRQRVNRDLGGETTGAQRLIAACPTLQAWSAGQHEWRIDNLEAALAFLEEVQAAASPVSFEWPDGEPLKVTDSVGANRLSLHIASARDWFEISGRISVDEELVLDMQEVLARLDQARGRFVPLDGGRFLALTADFKRALQQFNAVSDETAHGRRLHGLGAPAVEDLIEDAGNVAADPRWHDLLARIRAAGTYQPVIPSNLQAELRDYQREGFLWLSRVAYLEMGACLADDMGLGKTVQAITLLLEQAERGPSLVIAPTSVCHNWESELARFAPTLAISRLAAATDRRACVEALGPGTILIASYGLLQQDDDALAARSWNVIVFDEAQNLKNFETKRAQASRKLEARIRLALSGTPIENYLEELWSLFNIINPGLLGSRERFVRRFVGPIDRGDPAARNALRALIRPFILRRTKSAVLSELPPRTELTIEVTQGEEERAFYEAVRRQALANLAALDGPSGQRKIHILAEITRLRRACCHPALIDPGSAVESAKLRAFLDLTDELLRSRHKALVFSQFIGHLDKVRDALDGRGVRYQYIDGSVPAEQRAARVSGFQAGDGDLFLISLKAGGTGLNLTAADYVIHLDPWWNPAVEDQASDRAHRIGQRRPVTIYRLVVADSIEERILELHRHKRDLAADLLEGTDTSARLSEEELIAMIRQ
jgi:superfamily II DNA or RNA helicase